MGAVTLQSALGNPTLQQRWEENRSIGVFVSTAEDAAAAAINHFEQCLALLIWYKCIYIYIQEWTEGGHVFGLMVGWVFN